MEYREYGEFEIVGLYTEIGRRTLMAACAVVALVAAVLSFDALLSSHFRYEFALRRLLRC